MVMSRAKPKTRRSSSVAYTAAAGVYLGLGTDLSLSLMGHLTRREYKDIVESSIDPSVYQDPEDFRKDYLASELMSKYPEWDIGVDRKQVALQKFHESEQQCAETNVRLARRYVNGLHSHVTPESILWSARGKIARVLGSFNWDHAENHFGFGPGATTGLKSRHGDAYYKFRQKPDVTGNCAVLAHTCISRVPLWFNHLCHLAARDPEDVRSMELRDQIPLLLNIVPGNSICTVPKNAKTDRTIAIEPTMNGYVQKGLGGLIRSRLKRVGVDLDNQRTNQQLAHLGSIGWGLTTVDLASASDTVSMRLVEELLPPDWVTAIKLSRSPKGVLPDGTLVEYHKVSSMGNGYTFELESLIFWAISSAVCLHLGLFDRCCWVYGDDIIIPTAAYVSLRWILNYCGFSCNMKKTFSEGPFRESCGKHYFLGHDVTPIYLRKEVESVPNQLILINNIRRWSRHPVWGLRHELWSVWEVLRRNLPRALQDPRIPDGVGDLALIGDVDECRPRLARNSKKYPQYEGFVVDVMVPMFRCRTPTDLPYLLRGLSKPTVRDLLEILREPRLRGRKLVVPLGTGIPDTTQGTLRRVTFLVAQWPSYGPWVVPTI